MGEHVVCNMTWCLVHSSSSAFFAKGNISISERFKRNENDDSANVFFDFAKLSDTFISFCRRSTNASYSGDSSSLESSFE